MAKEVYDVEKPIPPDELPSDDNGGGGGGSVTPPVPKTWWQKNWMAVIGIGAIVLIIGVVLLVALL